MCITVSLLDGLVLARSGLHHSANYRSVMIFGKPTRITDPDQKRTKLAGLIDTLYPGRNNTLRPMTETEAKQTVVLSLPLEEASAKIRARGPVDDEGDYSLPIWAGTIPVKMQFMKPEPDPRNLKGLDMPEYVRTLTLGHS